MTKYLTPDEFLLESKLLKSTFARLGFDINALMKYFFDERGFEGVVVFNDPKDAYFDFHYHKADDFLCMLEGVMTVEMNGEFLTLQKGDCNIFPAEVVHNARIGANGARYLVATKNGDFESYHDIENKTEK